MIFLPSTSRISERCLVTGLTPLGCADNFRVDRGLEIVWRETCTFSDAGKHARTDLFLLMEREDEIWPAAALQHAMRCARLPLDGPADSKESGENSIGL